MNAEAVIIPIESQVAGRFRFKKGVINPDGSETVTGKTGWFDNRILNNGLNQMGRTTEVDLILACQVGTGSAAVDDTQTTLSNRIATTTNRTSNVSSIVTGPPRYGRRTVTFRFAQGAAAGNLTEVGISYQKAAAGLLYSRALIQDALGVPTVLTVLAMEFLDVEYEVRLYIPTGDTTANITVGGVPTVVTIRPAINGDTKVWCSYIPTVRTSSTPIWRQWTYSGALAGENTVPTGVLASYRTPVQATYVDNNFYVDYACTYGISVSNGTVRSMVQLTSLGAFQFEYNPPIPKDNTKNMVLRCRHSWSRYVP